MAETKVSDIIVPEIFNPYLIQETAEKNAFIKSGIAAPTPGVNFSRGGRTVTIPMWNDLDDTDEVLTDANGLTLKAAKAYEDVAVIHARGWAYGSNDIARLLAGDDPMKAIVQKSAAKWSKIMTRILVNTLVGAMGCTGMKDSVLDNSGKELTADMMADGSFLLGDSYDKIHAVAFAAPVLAKLKKLDLIDTVKPSDLEPSYFEYMGKRVILDDSIKGDTAGNYPIYFFGEGAISYNENPALAAVETERKPAEGIDAIYSRRAFTMHPRGIKWVGTPAGQFPTDEELATTSNWELVDNRKNVAIAQLIAKVGPSTTNP